MTIARRRSSALRRKKNPGDRELLYAALAGSAALGVLGYVATHRALPVVGGVLVGMVVTPVLLGANAKQLKRILFEGRR